MEFRSERQLHIPTLIIPKNTLHVVVLEMHSAPIPRRSEQALRHISDEPGRWNEKSRFLCQAVLKTIPNFLIAFGRNGDIPLGHHQLLNITKHWNLYNWESRHWVSPSLARGFGARSAARNLHIPYSGGTVGSFLCFIRKIVKGGYFSTMESSVNGAGNSSGTTEQDKNAKGAESTWHR